MNRSLAVTATAALALGPAWADAQRQPPRTSTDVHAAWLNEILDLDAARATAAYRRLALRPDLPLPQRHLAVARLAELARVRPVPDLEALQSAVRLTEAQRGLINATRTEVPIGSIQAALRDDPEAFDQWLRDAGEQQPGGAWQAHPLVPTFYADAVTVSGPERVRQRQQLLAQLNAARNTGDLRRVRSLQRELRELGSNANRSRLRQMRALRVLALLLDDEDDLAERLTKAWFREPAAIAIDDQAKAIARARDHLTAELNAPGLQSSERTVLERLATRFDGWSDTGRHRTAIRFLMKVPVYRNWLVPTTEGR